jgi:mandelamide amidase
MADFTPASDLAAAVAAQAVLAENTIEDLLSRIERLNPVLHAVITVNHSSIDTARRIDEGAAATRVGDRPPQPLLGVPIIVKDNIHVAGMACSAGTPALENFLPSRSAPAVEALQAAGAIVIGKANLHELAMGVTNGGRVPPRRAFPISAHYLPATLPDQAMAGARPVSAATPTGHSVPAPRPPP